MVLTEAQQHASFHKGGVKKLSTLFGKASGAEAAELMETILRGCVDKYMLVSKTPGFSAECWKITKKKQTKHYQVIPNTGGQESIGLLNTQNKKPSNCSRATDLKDLRNI